jgi:hypothetical protein
MKKIFLEQNKKLLNIFKKEIKTDYFERKQVFGQNHK